MLGIDAYYFRSQTTMARGLNCQVSLPLVDFPRARRPGNPPSTSVLSNHGEGTPQASLAPNKQCALASSDQEVLFWGSTHKSHSKIFVIPERESEVRLPVSSHPILSAFIPSNRNRDNSTYYNLSFSGSNLQSNLTAPQNNEQDQCPENGNSSNNSDFGNNSEEVDSDDIGRGSYYGDPDSEEAQDLEDGEGLSQDTEEEGEEDDDQHNEDGASTSSVQFDPVILGLKEISNLGKVVVSSYKPENGVEELRSDDLSRFWQYVPKVFFSALLLFYLFLACVSSSPCLMKSTLDPMVHNPTDLLFTSYAMYTLDASDFMSTFMTMNRTPPHVFRYARERAGMIS